jgi:hypothetical protein
MFASSLICGVRALESRVADVLSMRRLDGPQPWEDGLSVLDTLADVHELASTCLPSIVAEYPSEAADAAVRSLLEQMADSGVLAVADAEDGPLDRAERAGRALVLGEFVTVPLGSRPPRVHNWAVAADVVGARLAAIRTDVRRIVGRLNTREDRGLAASMWEFASEAVEWVRSALESAQATREWLRGVLDRKDHRLHDFALWAATILQDNDHTQPDSDTSGQPAHDASPNRPE